MSELVGQSEQALEQATGRKPYAAPELVVLKGGDTEGKSYANFFESAYGGEGPS